MTETEDRIRALPIWTGIRSIEPLSGGLSNESYTVVDRAGKFVVRFMRDFPFHHVSRVREIMSTRAAHRAGFCPELVHAEPTVMVSRFIEGQTYAAADVLSDLPRVVDLTRRFHEQMILHVSGAGFAFWVFHVIRDYADTLRRGGHRLAGDLPGWLEVAEALEAVQVPLPIVFGHNDLLPANFLDDGRKLWLIDFEYAGFGTAMFDLAGIASNAGFSDEQSEALLAAYFGEVTADLRGSHAAMQCASLLREAMWSMVSELYLDAPGADYVEYTDENLAMLENAVERYRSSFGKG